MSDKKDIITLFQPNVEFWESLFPQEKISCYTFLEDEYFYCEIIDELFYVKFEDGSWEIGYHFRYGPLDFGAILEIEHLATAIYAWLKQEWPKYEQSLCLTSSSHYPDNEISVGWGIDHIVHADLFKMYLQARVLDNRLYRLSNIEDTDAEVFSSNIDDILHYPLKYIGFHEISTLKSELGWIEIILLLEYYNFHSMDTSRSVYNKYTNGSETLIISNIVDPDDDIEAKVDASTEIQYVARLNDYILLKDEANKYLCDPNLYTLILKLVQMLDSWEDSKKVRFYITPQKEILIRNEVFTGIQPIYLLDYDHSNEYLVNQELSRMGKLLEEIDGIKFVDAHEIIEAFCTLVDNEETSEREIQNYIYNYYKILLGKKYSIIHTEVSINYEDETEPRRIDIMVYDNVRKDWDIYELKRACCGKTVIRTRGIVSFSAHVNKAIAQVCEYKEMLIQREIKRQLSRNSSINIKNPQYYLLIGNNDSEEWSLCCGREKEVNVLSYKTLIDIAKCSDRWTISL